MRLSKGKTVKRILAVFLALTVPAGSSYAAEQQSPKENMVNEGAARQEEMSAEDEKALPDEKEVSAEEEELQKRIRVIEVEEEVTKVCGELFLLDVTLSERPKNLDGEGTETDGGAKADDAGEESAQEKAEDTEEAEGIERAEDTEEAQDIKEAEDTEEKQQAGGPEAVLQYASADPEIAVIEEGEFGEAPIRAVGAGDTVITITAPETEQYEKAEARVLLHVTAAETETLADEEDAENPAKPEDAASERSAEPEDAAASENPVEPEETADAENPAETGEPEGAVPLEAMSLLPASALTSVENTAGGISVKWRKIESAKGYVLERSTTGRSPWSKVKTAANGDDVTFIDTQVTEGSAYYYRVRALDGFGKEGLTSASKKIVRMTAPALSVGVAATGTELRWNRVKGCGGYYVYRRKPSQKNWTTVSKITQPGEITWRDTAAGNGAAYLYSVQAYKGNSMSPYSKTKSYVRVAAPSVKNFKRVSAAKFKLTWKRNTSASGYQIQYARNGMFVGAKKAAVKNAKTSSYTLSKLAKKQNYYARIRAYKKVGGKVYYSGWSAAGNVKKTRTTKVTPLSKKKKIFEIRTWAKQKMYQYDTLQGSCTDGTYAYYLLYNRRVQKCKLVKVKRSGLNVVKVSGALDVAHGNDMTYDKHRKRIVIVHSTGVDPKRLTSVHPKTLKVIESKHVTIPKKLAGGSAADAAGATAFSGIAYSSGRKQYAVLLSHNYNFVVLDSDLEPVRYVKVRKKNNYVVQGIDATDDYIMLAQSPKTSKQKYNIITVYDWDGNYISKINVKKGYEIESIYHVGSKYYAGFYRSYYKTYYKNVVKKVVVDGKEKKKKVKEKYRKFQRDNYVYQINGI